LLSKSFPLIGFLKRNKEAGKENSIASDGKKYRNVKFFVFSE
jgi:hypothetical protein